MVNKWNHPQMAARFRLVKYHKIYPDICQHDWGILMGSMEHHFFGSTIGTSRIRHLEDHPRSQGLTVNLRVPHPGHKPLPFGNVFFP